MSGRVGTPRRSHIFPCACTRTCGRHGQKKLLARSTIAFCQQPRSSETYQFGLEVHLFWNCLFQRAPSLLSQKAFLITNCASVNRGRFYPSVTKPPLHNVKRDSFLPGLDRERVPERFGLAKALG